MLEIIDMLMVKQNLMRRSSFWKEESHLDGFGTLKKIDTSIFYSMDLFGSAFSSYSVALFSQSPFSKENSRKA